MGVAAGAAGRYIVTAYIDAGDTLFSLQPGSTGYKLGINKIDIRNFTVELTARDSDQLAMKITYWQNGIQSIFNKQVSVQLTNSVYQFSLSKNTTVTAYDGSVGRFSGFFYERTIGGEFRIPGSGASATSTSNDIIIVAQPGR
ncbi:hypothetical protein GK091_24535 [Spirosoma agri]|uniref:Uncharacterized protein n=2 Tax=Spirosoma agri TaxID=1987381 RepID=A0A6M0IQ70_9BACT|nr:hypothetical protein [Spirosoma agri]